MKVVDFAGMSFVKGQRLKVVEETGTFYGKFDKFSMNNSRLDLIEVTNEAKRSCGRFRYFHQQYVISVQSTEEVEEELCKPEEVAVEPEQTCSLSEHQLEHITKTIKEPVIVYQPGSVYFSALADIYKHLTVGVAADNSESGRIYKINKLAISTSNQVYIFDLLQLNCSKTMGDLKELFESVNYLKLVFDCRMLLDNLKANFNIAVESTFDLMLAAAQFHPKNEVSSLAGCIRAVLHIEPPKIFSKQQETLVAFFPAIYQSIISSHFTRRFHREFEQFISPSKSIESFYSKFKPGDSFDTSIDRSIISGIKEIDFGVYESD